MTHICVSKLTITGSDDGLSPGWRQVIIWTNTGILLIGPLRTNFSENLIEILTFWFTKMRLKSVVCEMTAILSRPQCVKLSLSGHNLKTMVHVDFIISMTLSWYLFIQGNHKLIPISFLVMILIMVADLFRFYDINHVHVWACNYVAFVLHDKHDNQPASIFIWKSYRKQWTLM